MDNLTLTQEEKDEFQQHYIELIDRDQRDTTHWMSPAIAKVMSFIGLDPESEMKVSINGEHHHTTKFKVEW